MGGFSNLFNMLKFSGSAIGDFTKRGSAIPGRVGKDLVGSDVQRFLNRGKNVTAGTAAAMGAGYLAAPYVGAGQTAGVGGVVTKKGAGGIGKEIGKRVAMQALIGAFGGGDRQGAEPDKRQRYEYQRSSYITYPDEYL